jgi:hypothetical protein
MGTGPYFLIKKGEKERNRKADFSQVKEINNI